MRLALAFALLATPAVAQPVVVADTVPVDSLAAQVMVGVGAPVLLIRGEAHDFQLKPSQAKALENAALIFWVGPILTPALEGPLDALAAEKVTLSEDPGVTLRTASHSDVTDPHIWMDPANGKAIAARIAAELEQADPAHAAAYAANAAKTEAALDGLIATAVERLAPYQGARIVIAHDALTYYAARFGLTVAGTLTDPHSESTSARRIADLHAQLADQPADCILGQPGHGGEAAETLAKDTGTPYATIDPEGETLTPGPALYADLINGITDAVVACLSRR